MYVKILADTKLAAIAHFRCYFTENRPKTTTDDFMSLIIQVKWSHYVILWSI